MAHRDAIGDGDGVEAPRHAAALLDPDPRGIGLDIYQLQPGYMIKSWLDLGDPTTINPRTWSCFQSHEPQPDQGAGRIILDWFIQHNS